MSYYAYTKTYKLKGGGTKSYLSRVRRTATSHKRGPKKSELPRGCTADQIDHIRGCDKPLHVCANELGVSTWFVRKVRRYIRNHPYDDVPRADSRYGVGVEYDFDGADNLWTSDEVESSGEL